MMRSSLRALGVAVLLALVGLAAAQVPYVPGDGPEGAWRLLRIQSMDDSVLEARPPSRYTLVVRGDEVHGRADCNRFRGAAVVDAPAGVAFEDLASTRALCPDGGLSDAYLQALGNVVSFVREDDLLHLATWADGAILTFVPALPEVRYGLACDDGRERSWILAERWSAVLDEGDLRVLPRAISASGVRFADERFEAWNRGDELTLRNLTTGDAVRCDVVPPARD
jgi:heat shock protein HslJ